MGVAKEQIGGLSKKIEELTEKTKKAEEASKGLNDTVKTMTAGLVSTLGAFGAEGWLKSAFGNWTETQQSIIELESTLRANERQVESTMEGYEKFASILQDTTKYSDEQVRGLLKSAEGFQLTGKAAEDAVRQAIALASATGTTATAMMRLTQVMTKGGSFEEAQRFARYIPQLRGIRDQSEFVERYQKLVAAGMESVNKEANTGAGTLTRLANAYSDLMESFGKIVEEAIKPFVEGLIQVVKWVDSWDKQLKLIVVALAAVTTGVLALIAAATAISIIVGIVVALSYILVPLIAVFVALGVATALWVNSVGGVGEAWKIVQQAAQDAWAWMKPIYAELLNLWDTISTMGVQVWESVKKAAFDAWKSIVGDAIIDWTKLRLWILEALIAVEFGLKNLGAIATYVWKGMQLAALTTWEEIKFFFSSTMPALLMWFETNTSTVFDAVFNHADKVVETFVENLVSVFNAIPWEDIWSKITSSLRAEWLKSFNFMFSIRANMLNLMSGTLKFSDLWPAGEKPSDVIASEITKGMKKLPNMGEIKFTNLNLPTRELAQWEIALRQEFAAMGSDIATSYEAFRDKRLAEVMAWGGGGDAGKDKELDKLGKFGEDLTGKMTKGATKEAKKLDAVLFGSAEALARMDEYFDRMQYGKKETKGGPSGGKFQAAITGGADANQRWDKQADMLAKTNTILEAIKAQGENRVNLESADIKT